MPCRWRSSSDLGGDVGGVGAPVVAHEAPDRDGRPAAVEGDQRDVVARVGRREVAPLARRQAGLGAVVALVLRARAQARVERVDEGLVGGPEVADAQGRLGDGEGCGEGGHGRRGEK